ncbi:MAG: hypothetical protein BWY47_01633 [Bacteroidetes bacterium ADurb.Bin302]|nr:MAG: hypothetical protein BWY47_01633 [Bacteroidetes bacterium ADurb.Bin302]
MLLCADLLPELSTASIATVYDVLALKLVMLYDVELVLAILLPFT